MPCFYTEESKANYVCFHHHYREQNSYDFNNDGITKKKKQKQKNKTHSLLLSICCIYRYVLQNGGQLCLHQGIWDWTFCKWTTTTKMFWSRHTSSGYSTFESLCSLNCLKWSRFSCLEMYNIHTTYSMTWAGNTLWMCFHHTGKIQSDERNMQHSSTDLDLITYSCVFSFQ